MKIQYLPISNNPREITGAKLRICCKDSRRLNVYYQHVQHYKNQCPECIIKRIDHDELSLKKPFSMKMKTTSLSLKHERKNVALFCACPAHFRTIFLM